MRKFLIISGIFIFVLGLVWLTQSRLKNWQENIKKQSLLNLPSWKVKEFEEILTLPQSTSAGPQEFISQDGKFKILYPGDWFPLTEANFLENLTPPDLKEKYNLQALLLAQKMDGQEISQLIVYRGNFNLTIPEIIKTIKKSNQEQGQILKIIEQNIEDEQAVFTAEYQTSNQTTLYAKEKILLNGEEAFLITILAPSKSQLNSEETNFILNSGQLLTEKED